MTIPSSLLTPVKTFDVAKMKAAQGPLTGDLAKLADKIKVAPGPSPDASQSIADFKSRVTPATKTMYAAAQSGTLGKYPVESVESAKGAAISLIGNLQNYADMINKYGDGDLTPGGAYTPFIPETDQLNDTLRYLELSNKDQVEAARHQLVIDAAFLKNTFGADGDVFSVEDGQIKINVFDLTYNGETIARSFGGGSAASFRADGTIQFDARY